MGDTELKIENAQDFKKYIEDNRNELYKNTVRIEEIPPDDDWLQENEWDEIYRREVQDGQNSVN